MTGVLILSHREEQRWLNEYFTLYNDKSAKGKYASEMCLLRECAD